MRKGNTIDVLESAYDLSGTDETWLAAVSSTLRPYLDRGLGLVALFFDVREHLKIWGVTPVGADQETTAPFLAIPSSPMFQSRHFREQGFLGQ